MKLNFSINHVELQNIPVTQNEIGEYYWNGKKYFKPFLKNFDTSIPPKGYKKYGPKKDELKPEGSHWSTNYMGVNIRIQQPIDFSAIGSVRANQDVLLQQAVTKGPDKFCRVSCGASVLGRKRFTSYLDHVVMSPRLKIGQTIKKGTIIGTIDTTKNHLHIYGLYFGMHTRIRDWILSYAQLVK